MIANTVMPRGHSHPSQHLATDANTVSYNGLLVAVGYSNGAWECLDFETLERLPSVHSAHGNNMDKAAGGGPFVRRRTDKGLKKAVAEAVSDIKFSPDSSMVAVAGQDNYIDIWTTNYYGEREGGVVASMKAGLASPGFFVSFL